MLLALPMLEIPEQEAAADESDAPIGLLPLWRPTCPTSCYFDGRDVCDQVLPEPDVRGYCLVACPGCGLVRDVAYPMCCELAGLIAQGWPTDPA